MTDSGPTLSPMPCSPLARVHLGACNTADYVASLYVDQCEPVVDLS